MGSPDPTKGTNLGKGTGIRQRIGLEKGIGLRNGTGLTQGTDVRTAIGLGKAVGERTGNGLRRGIDLRRALGLKGSASFSQQPFPMQGSNLWRWRPRVLAKRILIVLAVLLTILLAGSYVVRSQPASLLAFLSPQGEAVFEGEGVFEKPVGSPSVFNSSVFFPSPAPSPSPLPSPMTALPSPDFVIPPPSRKPLPQVPSTACDFLRPRPPLGVEILINLSKQRLTVVRYKKVILDSPISSGRTSHPSTSGNFEVTQKDLHHYSTLYGYRVGGRYRPAAMKYFVRYNGAEGLHAGALPGYPASHGCIRLPQNKAAAVFRTVGVGTPVVVIGAAPRASKSRQRGPAQTAAMRAANESQSVAPPVPQRKRGWRWPSLATERNR